MVICGGMIMVGAGPPGFEVVLALLFMSTFVSAFLYTMSVPVLLLAGLTECYRERLRAMVYRDPFEGDSSGQLSLADGNPFEV